MHRSQMENACANRRGCNLNETKCLSIVIIIAQYNNKRTLTHTLDIITIHYLMSHNHTHTHSNDVTSSSLANKPTLQLLNMLYRNLSQMTIGNYIISVLTYDLYIEISCPLSGLL